MSFTVVEYYGQQNSSRCGYCKGTRCSHSHGMHAHLMTPQDYQDLIDRGWRRSGHYCYKPNNKITCCPSYTIRCDALEFKLSKSHKKILKKMNKFLTDGVTDKEKIDRKEPTKVNNLGDSEDISSVGAGIKEEPEIPNIPIRDVNITEILNTRQSTRKHFEGGDVSSSSALITKASTDFQQNTKGDTDDARPPRKKAKQMRLERKQQKLAAKGVALDQLQKKSNKTKNNEKTLQEYIADVPSGDTSCHKLRVALVPSNKGVTAEEFELYRKYQMAVHHDPPQKLTLPQFERFLAKSPLKLKLVEVNSEEFQTSLMESFGLYEKYQIIAHNDPPDGIEDYLFFLVRSPLKRVKAAGGPPEGYGSFHQQYWLDDKLIAVGVIDILPFCISSVYFFYDPNYSFLSLGTYGSLREIDLIRQLSETVTALKYYYMGFYIHSCPKMRYKGKLEPSQLLCPEVYSWHHLTDEIRQKLDEAKYQKFCDDPIATDANEFMEQDVNSVLISVDGRTCIRFGDYNQIRGRDNLHDIILEYGKLTGRICALRMLFIK